MVTELSVAFAAMADDRFSIRIAVQAEVAFQLFSPLHLASRPAIKAQHCIAAAVKFARLALQNTKWSENLALLGKSSLQGKTDTKHFCIYCTRTQNVSLQSSCSTRTFTFELDSWLDG